MKNRNVVLTPIAFAFTRIGYFIYLLIAAGVGSLAFYLNLIVPKPETFWVLIQYLFGFTGKYFYTIVANIIAFISVFLLGSATMILSFKSFKGYPFFSNDSWDEDDTELTHLGKIIMGLLFLIGLLLIFLSFYWYFSYAAKLIMILIIIGIVGFIIMGLSVSNPKR